MKILVTGSAGFIGFHLSKSLLDEEYEIMGIDNINDYYDLNLKKSRIEILKSYKNFSFSKLDISHSKDIINVFKSFKPQKVVNLAAQAGVRYSIANPKPYIDSNLIGFVNIIESCKNFDVENLIYASSSSVYGDNKKTPFSINDLTETPISLYGATKRSNELIAYAYSHLYKLNTIGLRFFTVYGPWGRPDMAYYIFVKKIIAGEPISIFNYGNLGRDFTYIDDIIDGTKAAINKDFHYELFNLGNNKCEKLMDLVDIIQDEIGKKAIINFKPMQPGDAYETFADIQYSKEKLSYCPKISIRNGIPRFIKWYKEYYNV